MSLTQSHSAMLKRYLKEEIIDNEMKERSYIWKNCKKEYDWAGGVLEVPIKQNGFNSIQMGSLAATSDIAEYTGAVGTVNAHKEMTMSAIFREADLARHTDKEKSYLENIPGMIDDLSRRGAEQVGIMLLRGSAILSKATANGDASGNITVENPEFFEPMMKVAVDDDNSSVATGYVRTVDINTGIITLYDARSGGSVVDLSGYTTAQNARVQIVGGDSESFLDFKTALLPASVTGGSATLYGKTKASYLPLQAYAKDGSTFTANTILSDLLATYWACRKLGRGDQKEIWVNYGLFKNAAAGLELSRQYQVTDKSAGYGWNSISLVGNEGSIKLVALREMPKDVAYFVDPSAYKFKGLPLKKKMYGEAGLEYYVDRQTTGISFVTDMALRGDFIINPAKMGVVHSLPDAVSA
jgi:hypothetical protein